MRIPPSQNFPEAPGLPATARLPRWGPWATLGWGASLALAMALFQNLGALGFLYYWDFAHPGEPIARTQLSAHGGLLAFALLLSAPPLLGLLALAVRLSRYSLRDYLALRRPGWRELILGVAVLGSVLFGVGMLAGVTGQETPDFMAGTYNSAREAGMLPLLAFSFVLLAPLQEELLFRGFFYRGLAPRLGVWPAILLTAAAWSITHVQYRWFFVAEIFLLGIVLGWLRARSGSTLLTAILHAMINALALLTVSLSAGT
jgi:uncharacterized protein